ncbi:MAG TPA: GLPGLI family protein [Flavobacteriales bacterium]|nr:GLPGLI family protein [Flavobacteriales bacterium]
MKLTALTLALIAAGITHAQKQGSILFKETVKMEFQMELDSNMRAMLGDMPTENTTQHQLLFNEKASLFELVKQPENQEKKLEEEGHRIEIKMDMPDEKTYCDLENARVIQQREFMGKKFLIDTAFSKPEWKMTGKQKQILGYPCSEAVKVKEGDTCYAWFTPKLPVSTGPHGLHGLPGMILETTFMSGNVSLVAEKIDLVSVDEKMLVKPKEGKKVTHAQYKKIVDEKTKEMQEQYGGKGNVIIKMETR